MTGLSQRPFLGFLTLISSILTLAPSSVRASEYIDAVFRQFEASIPQELKLDGKKNIERLKQIASSQSLSDRAVDLNLRAILRQSQIGPSLFFRPTDLGYWQMTAKVPDGKGIFVVEQKGSANYIKYVLPRTLRSTTPIQRGDKITKIISNNKGDHTVEIQSDPTSLAKKVSYDATTKSYYSMVSDYIQSSSRTIHDKAKKRSWIYLHLIDCSKPLLTLTSRITSQNNKPEAIIIDLRDSYCPSSTDFSRFHSNLDGRPITILQNSGTKGGAEKLITLLKASDARVVTTVGEPSAGIADLLGTTISNSVIIATNKNTRSFSGPLQPDIFLKDSYIFAKGHDDLLGGYMSLKQK
ncbi:MAG: hypothetical protein HRU19_06365 [Pseudobacteriovorax sp.]|nr:hypothetical protein [Pseudobacteriovorax sp.]